MFVFFDVRLLFSTTFFFFFFNNPAPTEIYPLPLHAALPICAARRGSGGPVAARGPPLAPAATGPPRSEEHTSELQSPCNLVCRLLLEKKKNKRITQCAANYTFSIDHPRGSRRVHRSDVKPLG